MAKSNREVVSLMNPNVGMVETQVYDFTRINFQELHGSKLDENHQVFIEGIQRIVDIMGALLVEKEDLAAYQLKGVLKFGLINIRERDLGMLEEKLNKKARESKRENIDCGDISHSKTGSGGRQQFCQKSSGQNSSNTLTPKFNKYRAYNPRPQGVSSSGQTIPACKKCGKSHRGECLAGSGVCFGCGKMRHHVKDCPSVATRDGGGRP
ncbi:uncharacterized protein LOC129905075 [Solanum dulcamara]|uniref:uncharacterized protein LOC129905075 n=1 Tax=Solanum dulcamara TaxID=45834 RepID=UPI0024857E90|nr:uncharacterized protein LOC129905075 [Solanum dulcamara]